VKEREESSKKGIISGSGRGKKRQGWSAVTPKIYFQITAPRDMKKERETKSASYREKILTKKRVGKIHLQEGENKNATFPSACRSCGNRFKLGSSLQEIAR